MASALEGLAQIGAKRGRGKRGFRHRAVSLT